LRGAFHADGPARKVPVILFLTIIRVAKSLKGDLLKQEFLNKAKENLKIARLSFDNECYNASANRAYFAAFQAAVAAFSAQGIHSGKNEHAWVQSEFNLRLIKRRKVYPAKLKAYLLDMQQARNKADYSEKDVGKNASRKQLSCAAEMIDAIEKELIR
jgi:uncharacterized protein (UPF0332 family)